MNVRNNMVRNNNHNTHRSRKTKIAKHMEFSKMYLIASSVVVCFLIVLTSIVTLVTSDLTALCVLIPSVFAEQTAATSFYYWKAKNENINKHNNLVNENEDINISVQ